MNKIFKKVCAFLLCAAMMIPVLTGCSTGNSGMFSNVKEAMKLTKYTANTDITVKSDDTKMTLSVEVINDGEAQAVNFEVNYGGISFKLDGCLVYSKNVVYINADEIVSRAVALLSMFQPETASSVDSMIQNYVKDLGWISINCEQLAASDSTLKDDVLTAMDKYFAKSIKKDNGVYSITVDDTESLAALLNNAYEMIKANYDQWVETLSKDSKAQAQAYNDFCTKLYDDVAEKLKESGADLTLYDSIPDAYKEMSADGFEEYFEQLTENKDEYLEKVKDEIEKIEDDEDYIKNQLGTEDFELICTSSQKKGVYEFTASVTKDTASIEATCTISPEAKTVTVPSNATDLVDLVASLYGSMSGMADSIGL